jgi:hypothetical protein
LRAHPCTHIVLGLFVAAAGCQILTGADQFDFAEPSSPASTASAGGGGGGTGSGGSEGGSFAECLMPADCPGVESTCAYRTCEDETCGIEHALAGVDCSADGGTLCNGSGACVACLEKVHCDGTDECDKQKCVPAACADTLLSTGETDVDCGGLDCARCEVGEGCFEPSDCESLYCAEGSGGAGGAPKGDCALCSDDEACSAAEGSYCDQTSGWCVPQKGLGEACGGTNQCASGFCVDGVCCDSACTGTCRACRINKSGSPSGSCTVIPNGNDPDSECPLGTCNGNGGCGVLN